MSKISELEQLPAPVFDKVRRLRLDKDGTFYDIVALHCPEGFACGTMAHSSPCWLIVSGLNGKAYAFREKGYLAWDYIMEKLGRTGDISTTDAMNLVQVINAARDIKE